MNTGDLLAQNIDLLVFGPTREKLVNFLNINKNSTLTYTKKPRTKKPSSKADLNEPVAKTEDLSKLQSTYYSKINKLQDLVDDNKSINAKTNTEEKEGKVKNYEAQYFTWGDFKKTTTTISTLNFWINVNYCLISDMFLDPYINSVISGNLNILIITFNPNDKESCKKALKLYLKLETDKPPSSIKYQSQRLLLQQGYYHSYNENIVLALCEMPNIEPFGKCLLVGFGEKEEQSALEAVMKEMNIKKTPKTLIIEEGNMEGCSEKAVEIYEWIIEAHQKMQGTLNLEESHKKEIKEVVQKGFVEKHPPNKEGCRIF